MNWLNLADFPEAPAVVEDADTFAGNAAKKAKELAEYIRCIGYPITDAFVLADDSGLEVDELNGAPGVYSARFAYLESGEPGNAPDTLNNTKLLKMLADVPEGKRTARFRCVLAWQAVGDLRAPLPVHTLFEGKCEGNILFAPQGETGFGYDPLFVPTGHGQSFAELGEEIKNHLSHRGQAAKLLGAWLAEEL